MDWCRYGEGKLGKKRASGWGMSGIVGWIFNLMESVVKDIVRLSVELYVWQTAQQQTR